MDGRAVLKTFFQTGDKPTQAQFADLIDSCFNKVDDAIAIGDVAGLAAALAALWAAISGLTGTLVDAVPTAGSSNAAGSGGTFDALATKAAAADLTTHAANLSNPHQTSLEQARTKSNLLAGNIDANGNQIINLTNAVNRQDALTKGQFDDVYNTAGRNRGSIDASTNPNYPASNVGDRWEITVAGFIGGGSGIAVDAFDEVVCKTASAAGNQAAVGANFYIVQGNIQRATESTGGYAQLATNAQAVAFTDDTTIVTPLKGKALFVQAIKTVSYQINAVSLTEVSVYMESAGNVNSILISGANTPKLKIGIAGTYPVGAQTFPFAYAAGDRVFISFIYTDLTNASCNVKLKCQDN